MKNKKTIFGIALAVALVAVATFGITTALLKDSTGTLTNTFDLGSVETKIYEEGSGAVKKSRIKNEGENSCYVRARVTISPAEAAEQIDLTGKDEENWDWSQWAGGDGYVYYKKAIAPGEYTSYLFEGVELKDYEKWLDLGISTFDVTVYEESVQSSVTLENGTKVTDREEVWKIYDSLAQNDAE